jgi:hypothetical protein
MKKRFQQWAFNDSGVNKQVAWQAARTPAPALLRPALGTLHEGGTALAYAYLFGQASFIDLHDTVVNQVKTTPSDQRSSRELQRALAHH